MYWLKSKKRHWNLWEHRFLIGPTFVSGWYIVDDAGVGSARHLHVAAESAGLVRVVEHVADVELIRVAVARELRHQTVRVVLPRRGISRYFVPNTCSKLKGVKDYMTFAYGDPFDSLRYFLSHIYLYMAKKWRGYFPHLRILFGII